MGPSAFFFFNDTATTEIYTLSLHDALPIYRNHPSSPCSKRGQRGAADSAGTLPNTHGAPHHHSASPGTRSEEHTSELQSQSKVVFRPPLLTKKEVTHDRTVSPRRRRSRRRV